MATRTEFNRFLKTISPDGTAFSASLKRSVALLDKSDLEDIPDLLGDASEGDFDFLRFSTPHNVGFADGVEPDPSRTPAGPSRR